MHARDGRSTDDSGEGFEHEGLEHEGLEHEGLEYEGLEHADAAHGPDVHPELESIDPRSGGVVDRRSGLDRRLAEQGSSTHLERRRGPGRRLSDFVRDAEEGQMNQEQFMFLMAIDAFKRVNGKTFPAWSDVLEVVRKLGYRKTMPSELNLGGRVEDWRERADAPSNTTPVDANVAPPTRRSAA